MIRHHELFRSHLACAACRRLALAAAALGCLILLAVQPVSAQLRIVTYNTNDGPRSESFIVLQEIGNESTGGIARPIDILLLQEQDGGSIFGFEAIMDGLYGGIYARPALIGSTAGAGQPGVVYNTQTVQLIAQVALNDLPDVPRPVLRYQFRPVGYDSTADFYIYNSHYKAGTGATNEARRDVEATLIRTDSDALGEGTHILYAGDFNIKHNGEAMWGTLTTAGAGQAVDPINQANNFESWIDNPAFVDRHTQSPVASARFSGQVTGGMDDRFDFILSSGEFLDGEGFSLISGSYHAFGNNGTHPLNAELDQIDGMGQPFNTALPLSVLNAIANSSDHLPVVVDYQLPAVMGVTVAAVPAKVLAGAGVQLQVDVENTAGVVHTSGADELDYTLTTADDISGGPIMDTAAALAGPNSHLLTLDTASGAGAKSATIDVNSSSQQVQNGSFNQMVAFDVVDHANPSFDSPSDVDMTSVDFGVVGQGSGSGTLSQALALHNLEATLGFTAALDLDMINGAGDNTMLTTNLAPLAGIAAGGSTPFDVFLDTGTVGLFAATYTLTLSDEDLPGEMTGVNLTLDLQARVALIGDATLDDVVGADDYTLWANNFGTGTLFEEGDFNDDDLVGADDYTLWANNFGASAPGPSGGASAAVPEPSALGLFVLGVAGFLLARCRRVLGREAGSSHGRPNRWIPTRIGNGRQLK